MFTRVLAPSVVIAAGLAIAGCGNSPGALCQGTVDRIQDLWARCHFTPPFEIRNAEGEHTECGFAARVTNPDELVDVCWPWLESVSCEEVLAMGSLDPSCDISTHFQGY